MRSRYSYHRRLLVGNYYTFIFVNMIFLLFSDMSACVCVCVTISGYMLFDTISRFVKLRTFICKCNEVSIVEYLFSEATSTFKHHLIGSKWLECNEQKITEQE